MAVLQEVKKGALTVDTLHDAMWLFVVVPFVSFVCGTCNSFSLCIFNLAHWNQFFDIWPTWVLGDLSAILCVTPCILHLWNILHPDLLPIWGQTQQSRIPGNASQADDDSQPHIGSEDGVISSEIVESQPQSLLSLSNTQSDVALLPLKDFENYREPTNKVDPQSLGTTINDSFSHMITMDTEDRGSPNGIENARTSTSHQDPSVRESLEKWKAQWNKWVLDRRGKLCSGGVNTTSMSVGEEKSESSREPRLNSGRRRFPRCAYLLSVPSWKYFQLQYNLRRRHVKKAFYKTE